MKKNYYKINTLIGAMLFAFSSIFAQGTLEMTRNGLPTNNGFGTSIDPMAAPFFNDALNSSVFTANSPALTMTISFSKQIFTGFNYGSATNSNLQTTGLVFGAGPSLASDGPVQGATPYARYNLIGQYGGNGGPTDPMFTSSPSSPATTASTTPSGTGIKVAGSNGTSNGAFEVFTTAQVLFGSSNPIGSRVYFGDIVLNFNRPVKNPVIHIAGLGGSYRFLPIGLSDIPSNYKNIYFSTELELSNSGLTSTLMSGNQFIQLSGNNILNNNNVNPNGGSVNDPFETPFNNLGAATGSVRLNGTVQQVTYRVYLESGTGSSAGYPWSAPAFDNNGSPLISGAQSNPFTGDIWYISASMDKPLQQISGNVIIDRDGLTDNDINKSAGVENPKTNVGGTLYANLLNSLGQVVASTPVSADGSYLFDAVPVGTYTVQLTTVASSGTYASPAAAPATILPSGWANTGEFNGTTPGSDGTVNGRSAAIIVTANDIKTDVNFGIELLPESVSFSVFIPTPQLNAVITLNGTLPVLTGSDPEDLPTTGSLSGRTVRIDSLPSNTQLLYGGVVVTLGQTILNYNPSLLQVKFTTATPTGETAFKYSFVDAAGLADPTPAKYTIRWPNNGPLNITLADFTAVKNNCFANLVWKTSSEINSDKFEVEVSSNVNAEFKNIGSIAASLNSNTVKAYQFNYAMETGVVYYFRLKMFNKDGSFTYSVIRQLSCNDVKTQIAIAPNPVNDIFKISGMAKGKNTITIISADGKIINSQIANSTTIAINISQLSSGMYIVRILNEDGTANTERVIKK